MAEAKPESPEERSKRLRQIAELIRQLVRAAHGMEIDAKDIMIFLVNADDLKERTRLDEYLVYAHSAMHTLAGMYPREFQFLEDIAKLEDAYFISLNGEQRKEMILMQKAKLPEGAQSTQQLSLIMPNTKPIEEQQQPQPQQKKGFLHRGG